MATEIENEITALEAELARLDTQLANQQHLDMVVEGGGVASFSTRFTKADVLFKRRDLVKTRLATLKRGAKYV